jgi:hypothetical protein
MSRSLSFHTPTKLCLIAGWFISQPFCRPETSTHSRFAATCSPFDQLRWQVAIDSEDWIIVDTLLEDLMMLTWAVNEVFLPGACEADSRCDCACLDA